MNDYLQYSKKWSKILNAEFKENRSSTYLKDSIFEESLPPSLERSMIVLETLNNGVIRNSKSILKQYNTTSNGIYYPQKLVCHNHESRSRFVSLVQDTPRSFSNCDHVHSRKQLQFLCFHVVYALLNLYSKLHYYQGLHDVASVLILATTTVEAGTGDELLTRYRPLTALSLFEKQTLLYLRDFCSADLCSSLAYLKWLGPLVYIESPPMFALLAVLMGSHSHSKHFPPISEVVFESNAKTIAVSRKSAARNNKCWKVALTLNNTLLPTFALSWVITWFAHDFNLFSDFHLLAQIWDFCFLKGPAAPLYLSAIFVAHTLPSIVQVGQQSTKTSDSLNFPAVHSILVNTVHQHKLNLEALLIEASKAFDQWPPDKFGSSVWDGIRLPEFAQKPVWVSHCAVSAFALDYAKLRNCADSSKVCKQLAAHIEEASAEFADQKADIQGKQQGELVLRTRVSRMWLKKQLLKAQLTFSTAATKSKTSKNQKEANLWKPLGVLIGLAVLGASFYIRDKHYTQI